MACLGLTPDYLIPFQVTDNGCDTVCGRGRRRVGANENKRRNQTSKKPSSIASHIAKSDNHE